MPQGFQERKRPSLREAFEASQYRGYDPRLELTPEGVFSLLQPVVPATEKLLSLPGLEPLTGESFPAELPREWMPEMERAERVRAYGRGVAQTMGDLLPVTPLDIAGGAAAGLPTVARGAKAGLRLAQEGLETGAGLARGATSAARSRYLASPLASEAGFASFGGPALPRPEPRGPFFSRLTETVSGKLPAKANAAQIEATLKNAGVSPAEMDAVGLSRLFKERGQNAISKDELAQWIDQNRVRVEEEVIGGRAKGEPRDTTGWRVETTEPMNQYTGQRGVQVFDEDGNLVSTRPATRETDETILRQLSEDRTPAREAPFSQWQLPGGENYRIVAVKAAPQPSPHYGYPESAGFAPPHQGIPDNTIVHMRMNDRVTPDGKKALFVEEVQSDWANTGRKEGFKQELTPEVKAEIETLEAQRRRAGLSSGIEAGARYTELTRQIDQLRGVDAVPNHPLLSRYPEVAMKRALYEAADGGYDSLAWTTGKQQADRYDLSKHVDSIEWVFDKTDGLYDLNITTKTGEFLPRQVAPDDLPNEIGKDIAGKMAASVEAGENFGKLKGLDLKIGGEWATNLYDKQLVNIVNKLAKKWGGKVGSKTIITDAPSGRFRLLFSTDAGAREQWFNARADAEEWMRNVEHTNPGWMSDAHIKEVHGKETTVHSLDITPEMRAAIKKQGFPLFEGAGAAIGGETLRQAYEEGRRQQNMPELPRVGY